MSSIDQRVVQMQFDNKQFEGGVQSSIKSLDSLKKGLNFEGAAKGLNELGKVGNSLSFANLASGVSTISDRFTTMGIVGVTALVNITNAAIATGSAMLKSLTVEPIMSGFKEYETKMGSIQTILTNTASKGTTLDDVNKALDELNTYSDQTIYNFEEMTRNIGTFTAAGVDLKTSTMAIKGIANLAAGSGSSAEQASTAMYQLSQALAAGKVGLQDWNSVVNAGMGGELFQKALEKTAKALGKGRDMSVSFRDSLKDGWITTEVLTKTLQQFADDPALVKAATQVKTFTQLFDTMKESVQSGWAKTWETIIGGKDESSNMLTNINNVFGEMISKSAEARNSMLEFWKANGGRDAMIQAVTNTFQALQSVLKPIGDAFRSIFPAMTGQQLVALTREIKEFTAGLKIGDTAAYNLKNTFQGVFAVLDIIKQAVTSAGKAFFGLINSVMPAGNGIMTFVGHLGQYLTYIDDVAKRTKFFDNIFANLANNIKWVANSVGAAMSATFKWFAGVGNISVEGITYFVDQVIKRFEPFKALGGILGVVVSGISKTLSTLAPIFTGLADTIGNALDKMRDSIKNTINGGGNNSVLDIVNTGLFAAIVLGIRKFINSLSSITSGAGGVLDGITDILDGVKGSLQAYQTQLKAGALLKIASAIGILALSLLVISTIDAKKLTSSLTAISTMFVELFISMGLFEKLSGGGLLTMGKLSIGMIGLSTAILTLSAAMHSLAKLDWNGIAKGLVGIGVIMAELAVFMTVTNFSGMGVSTGLGIIALAEGINILATAVQKFGGLDTGVLTQGLIGVGAVLAEIALFVNMTGNAKGVVGTAVGLTILATSLLIFAQAINMMGNMSWEVLGKGLLTMAGALAIVAAAVALLPGPSLILTGAGLIGIATALTILAGALILMGGMSWESVGVGLVTLAGALTIIAVAMTFMQTALPGAAALLVIAAALTVLAPVLILLGSASLVTIGTGLLALAGAFTVIGVAGLLLAPLVPVILGLSAAIALLGVGCLAVGAGLLMFSAGITALAAAGAAGTAAVVLFITSIVNMIPSVAKTLAQGVVSFAKTIGDGAPVIAASIGKVITSMLQTIVTLLPQIADAGFKLIDTLLQTISKNINKLVDTGAKIIVSFIDGITRHTPELVQAGFSLIITFIEGLATAIENNKQTTIEAVQHLISAMVDTAVSFIKSSYDKMVEAGANLVLGFIQGIKNNITAAANEAATLAKAAITAAKSALDIHSPSRVFKDEVGAMVAAGMADGIKLHAKEAKNATEEMCKDVVDTAKAWIDERKYYNKISLEEEYYVWQEIQKKYDIGTEERIKADKEVYRVKNELYKQDYDNAIKWIDNAKYYNQLSLEEELATWEAMRDRYAGGTDEREKAEKEVYRVQNEINAKKKESDQEVFDNAVKLIDDKKYYNKLSLGEELEAWKNLQAQYAKGTAEREKADKEAYRVQQELNNKRKSLEDDYYSKTKSVNDKLTQDIKSVNDEYDNALKSRTDAIYKSYGLFDKVAVNKPVSGAQLTLNLENQVQNVADWQNNMNDLAKKGVGDDFIKEIRDMGPQSLNQIKALNEMSQPELDKYVALWKTKHDQAKDEALGELDDLKTQTTTKIQALTDQASIDLQNLRTEWASQMSQLNAKSSDQLTELNTTFDTKIDTLTKTTTQQFVNMSQTIKNMDWIGVGNYVVQGMINGIQQKTEELAQVAADTALAALNAAKKALGINSPSKEFAELGMYADEGMAVGLSKFSGIVEASASSMGETAINSLKKSISGIAEAVNSDINLSPVIRPVLDLSNVESGSKQLNGLFAITNGLNVGSIRTKIPNIQNQTSTTASTNQNGNNSQTPSISFTQNNYSPEALSRIDIYRQTRNQISTLKGLVMNQ